MNTKANPIQSALNQDEESLATAQSIQLRIARSAYREMLEMLMAKPVESGGILLGPIGCEDVTHFHFDASAACTGATYSPDHIALNKLLRDEWIPSGIDFKGFSHSHPDGVDRLSAGDLRYIRRLLAKNEDMDQFAAPLLVPGAYQLVPLVVPRAEPNQPHIAELVLF